MRRADIIDIAPSQNGAALLGDLFFWKLPGLATYTSVEQAALAEGNGLDALVPAAPTDAEVLRRVAHVAREGGKHDVTRVSDDKMVLAYSVALKKPDAVAERTDYEHKSVVRLDKLTGQVSSTGPEAEVIERAWLAARGHLGRPEWSSFALAVASRAGALTLREKGGFYWSPAVAGQPNSAIRQLDRVFRAHGGRLGIIPIYDTDEGRQTLQEESGDNFLADLQELRAEIDDFDARTRLSTLEGRLERLQELRTRANFVAALLREGASQFDDGIGSLEKRIKNMLLGLDGGQLDLPINNTSEVLPAP